MTDVFQIHDAARVRVGKYAGLVGTVTGTNPDKGTVRVAIDGVKDDQAVKVERWFKRSELGRNHG